MRLPDLLATVPAAALLLFDRGIINCGLFAQVLLARITFVTRARRTLPWPERWYGQVHRTSHAGDAGAWSGRGTDRV